MIAGSLLFAGLMEQAGVNLAVAPFVIPAIAAGIGGLANLFGGSEKKTYTVDDLIKYGYKPYNEGEELTNLNRMGEALKKDRRANVNEKAVSQGFSPTGSIFTNEEDILNSQMAGEQTIKKNAAQDKNKIAQMLFQLNESQPEDESDIMKFLSGAVGGAKQGFTIADIFKQVPGGSAG